MHQAGIHGNAINPCAQAGFLPKPSEAFPNFDENFLAGVGGQAIVSTEIALAKPKYFGVVVFKDLVKKLLLVQGFVLCECV
jgi:hypothetical protein